MGKKIQPQLEVASMMARLDQVIRAHQQYMRHQLCRNGIEQVHSRAHFVSPHEIEMLAPNGRRAYVRAKLIVVATGSRPRIPPDVPVDHEHILDSDSILSMLYVPASLTVLGAGIIASEYASIFAILGTQVTMIDRAPHPIGFMDPELTSCFVRSFEANGGHFLGQRQVTQVQWDGLAHVETTLADGTVIQSDKMLCALGRVANTEDLNLAAADLQLTEHGYLTVDEHCRTSMPHIYAVGDVIGPPALAAFSMEQGRRAICHALGLPLSSPPELIPTGIYTIPEMASVGLSEQQAMERYGEILIGRAPFAELARGQIAGETDGMLKMVADAQGKRLLGVHIVGVGATELIHVGQMGLLTGCEVETFVENIFNFPTLAEAYRVAALDIAKQCTASMDAVPYNPTASHNGSSTPFASHAATGSEDGHSL